MKVVHINTFAGGGAGIAASRLHEALLVKGIDSVFVCKSEVPVKIKNSLALPWAKPSFLSKVLNKLGMPVAAEHIREQLILKYHPQCEFLGTPFSDYEIESLSVIQDADIISMHWVPGFINYKTFFKKIRKPIVWTIHDLSAFMGCFNYPIDIINNPQMEAVNTSFYAEKVSSLKGYPFPVHIVGPSKWILDAARKYQPFAPLSFHHIPYGIDPGQLKYIEKEVARKKLDLPSDSCILLFVSASLENKRKRFDRIIDLEKKLSGKGVVFIAVGGQSEGLPGSGITFTGNIDSLEKLNLYYAAADFFLMPSEEDNFPNVVLESLFCGTPVISNNTGGMKDIINPSNGFLEDNFNTENIAITIHRYLAKEFNFDRMMISQYTRSSYPVSAMADAYIKLYKQLL